MEHVLLLKIIVSLKKKKVCFFVFEYLKHMFFISK